MPEELDPEQSALAQAQLDRERRVVVEHGVKIPAWSDDARVVWGEAYRAAMTQSDERAHAVRRMVELAKRARVA